MHDYFQIYHSYILLFQVIWIHKVWTHFISHQEYTIIPQKTCQTDTANTSVYHTQFMRYEKMLMKKGCTACHVRQRCCKCNSGVGEFRTSNLVHFIPMRARTAPRSQVTETTARALLTWRKTNKPERERHEKHFLWKPISTKENKQKILKHHRI